MVMKNKQIESPEFDLCSEEAVAEAQEKELFRYLMRENAEFQRLGREYRELEAAFLNLIRTETLSPQQQTKKRVVVKLKDLKKERMNQILLSYKQQKTPTSR